MKGIQFHIKKVILYSLIILGCNGILHAQQLYKIFHHRVEARQNDAHFLELGKLILSFSHEPHATIANQETNHPNEFKSKTFFFSGTIINNECKEMMELIEKSKTPHYRISFKFITGPNPGLALTIIYDYKKVGVTHCSLEGTGNHKRMIITMYDKEQIKSLQSMQEPVLRTAFNNKKAGIIVDCGHGGQDCGAMGYFDLKEKDINLEVGAYVAYILDSRGYDVFLTRNKDITIALDERTLMTDLNKRACLLVSIHSNAAPNPYACGIETFFFDIENYNNSDTKASRLINALMKNRCLQSQQLAHTIHKSVLEHVHHNQPNIVDRNVKESFLQVLIGSSVPSALIELGFLTNKEEAALISNAQYKKLLALGICDGIEKFVKANH